MIRRLITLTALLLSVQAQASLNVSIAVFDPGVPGDQSLHRDLAVFPKIRAIEARLVPFVLREALANTGEWGAVRVVPEVDPAAELLVTGVVGRSDGDTLQLGIRAVDARGRVWLENVFEANIERSDAALFTEIEKRLRSVRDRLEEKEVRDVREISMLRYAEKLAPSAFGGYLDIAEDDSVTVLRLPAQNDPMLERIQRIRETEYVITDAVDAKYQELHEEIASVYELWRRYRRKSDEYAAQDAMTAAKPSAAPKSSYESLLEYYNNYKYHRVTSQEVDRLAVAFDNEVGPRIARMEIRIAELETWVDQKYATWHRLLEQLFEAETEAEAEIENMPELPDL